MFNLIVFSVVITFILNLFKAKLNYEKLSAAFKVIITYYLALHLLKYGFDKIFKQQFYIPEPNTLFTPIGKLDKDILYWSTMGTSYSYSVFSGLVEVIPAVLLLFNRTRGIGASISVMVMINVVAINFGFNISVKLLSVFLLFLSVLIAFPYWRKWYFLINAIPYFTEQSSTPNYSTKNRILMYSIAKAALICLLFSESLYIAFKENNFNDDKASRPLLHGAYKVKTFVVNADTLTVSDYPEIIQKVFFHRKGYFITLNAKEEFVDYEMKMDLKQQKLFLNSYLNQKFVMDFDFDEKEKLLYLSTNEGSNKIDIVAEKLELDSLPVFKNKFTWTSDELH